MQNGEADSSRTGFCGQSVLPYSNSEAIQEFFAKHREEVYHYKEVAKTLDLDQNTVGRLLRRLSGDGWGSGNIIKMSKGFYKYHEEKEKNPYIRFLKNASWIGIENFLIQKYAPGAVRYPPTPSFRTGAPDEPADSFGQVQNGQFRTGADSSRTGAPVIKNGFPLILPTGQRVEWHIYPTTGQEMIHFIVDGQPPFSPQMVLFLLDRLKKEGLDSSWWVVSIEANRDNRTIEVLKDARLQVGEGLIFKIYQHGTMARLEIADRRPMSFGEALEVIMTAADRGEGRAANKKAARAEKLLEEMAEDNRKLHNYLDSLSEKVHDGRGTRRRKDEKRKERKLT